ncbi:hypothetical protein LT493_11980 [Streptomyces tricolor]|nr:hypothetical protein [Streptomyces tricolor]
MRGVKREDAASSARTSRWRHRTPTPAGRPARGRRPSPRCRPSAATKCRANPPRAQGGDDLGGEPPGGVGGCGVLGREAGEPVGRRRQFAGRRGWRRSHRN